MSPDMSWDEWRSRKCSKSQSSRFASPWIAVWPGSPSIHARRSRRAARSAPPEHGNDERDLSPSNGASSERGDGIKGHIDDHPRPADGPESAIDDDNGNCDRD